MVIERSFMHHIKVLKTFLKPVLQKTSRHLKEISSVNVSSSVWASEDQIFEFCQNLSDFNFGEVFMIRKVSLAIVSRRMSVIAPMVRKHLAIDVYTQVSNLSMRRSCTPHVVLLMVSQTIQKKGILILSPEPHLLPLRGAPTWSKFEHGPMPWPCTTRINNASNTMNARNMKWTPACRILQWAVDSSWRRTREDCDIRFIERLMSD